MAYISGTLTDPNPGPTLYTAMSAALTTAGFTLVDTVITTIRTHRIWKSAAAGNAMNLDWYIDIAYTTTGAATWTMHPFEYFDPATDLGYRGMYIGGGSTIDAATSSRYGAVGYALETTNWGMSYPSASTSPTTALPATTFAYWMSVTPDRVILLNGNDPTLLMYVGFYAPDAAYAAKAGAALYPLVFFKGAASQNPSSEGNTAAVTRIPPEIGANPFNWSYNCMIKMAQVPQSAFPVPTIPAGPFTSFPATALPIAVATSSNQNYQATYGMLRDVAIVNASASVARGDTVTISGQPWVLTSPAGAGSLLFKAV